MRFEARELKPYAEPVMPSDLRPGEIYFAVNFVDERMLIPALEPRVFIGTDLAGEDHPGLYFQDLDSYQRGIRFETSTSETDAIFEVGAEKHIFEYEKALDVLLRCALNRRHSK